MREECQVERGILEMTNVKHYHLVNNTRRVKRGFNSLNYQKDDYRLIQIQFSDLIMNKLLRMEREEK